MRVLFWWRNSRHAHYTLSLAYAYKVKYTLAFSKHSFYKMCWSMTVDFWTTCVRFSHDGIYDVVGLWGNGRADEPHRLMWRVALERTRICYWWTWRALLVFLFSLSHIASSPPHTHSPPGLLLLRCSTECCSTMLSTTALFRQTSIMVQA